MEVRYQIDRNFLNNPRRAGGFRIFQIGRLYGKPTTRIPRHVHGNLFEITIVTAGRGVIETNSVPVPVAAGDIYVSFPGDFHALWADSADPFDYDFCAFMPDDGPQRTALRAAVSSFMPAMRRIIRDERISYLVSCALSEVQRDEEADAALLEALFRAVTAYTLRGLHAHETPAPTRTSDAEALCYRMMQYIDTHMYEMAHLGELAAAMNYHYAYLSKLFHRVTGNTLSDYYGKRRLESARLLLGEGTHTVGEVAAMLRYTSVYVFSRAFRRRFGLSPRAWKKQAAATKALPSGRDDSEED